MSVHRKSLILAGLTPSGVRKEFQQALAELRTDLDAFTADESESLMALGYQMAANAFIRDLSHLGELSSGRLARYPSSSGVARTTPNLASAIASLSRASLTPDRMAANLQKDAQMLKEHT